MIRIYFSFLLVLAQVFVAHLCAQSSKPNFANVMEERLNSSQNQWLVKQIFASEPSSFDQQIKLPVAWDSITHLQLGEHHWHLTPEMRQAIQNIWYPSINSQYLIVSSSLMDLYQPLFRATCESQHLPTTFQWLPLLVSGINPHFDGPTGRRGLWALDYLTARKAGLEISSDVDERCGGDFTAKAVTTYLSSLMVQHKDPLKVLLIYLYGAPALADIGEIDFSKLPEQWQFEVSFLEFSARLFPQLRTQNFQRNYFDILAHYSPIRPKDSLSLAAMEAILNEDITNLRGMNPTLIGDRLLPIALKVPYYVSTSNAERWKFMEDSLLRWKPYETKIEIASPIQHKVRKGESLGSIAKKYKTSVRSIQKLNKLKGNQIRIGQVIQIPNRGAIQPDKPAQPIDGKKPKEKESVKSGEQIYIVKNGDSLWKIAKRYKGVSESDIKRWNKCGDNIRPGQKLIIKIGA